MALRDLFSNTHKNNRIFLGSPEAEAEAIDAARVPLVEVYEDFHGLSESLSGEKFIILSRKGCGKSAFAEFTKFTADASPNYFCNFIRSSHINLEAIIQLGKETGTSIEKETLFKWIIYTQLLNMFTENQAIVNSSEFDDLKKFLIKNSGYVKMQDYETKELIKKEGFEISIEYFKRFAKGRFGRDIQIRQEKAPFYKLIPHIELIIQLLLTSDFERRNNNDYLIFFDDLDIGYNNNDKDKVQALLDLLRTAKFINNEIFGRLGIKAKIIVLLRNDIAKFLSIQAADAAKIFSSYSTTIDWFQDGYGKSLEEKDFYLKKFINSRIAYAFTKSNLSFEKSDPWQSLVQKGSYEKSSFDYIIDLTLYRPRDLLLFFSPLDREDHRLPLNKTSINILARKYSEELVRELQNEMIAQYENINQIEKIFSAVSSLTQIQDCNRNHARKIISEKCEFSDPDDILLDLFDRSIIGTQEPNGFYYFKCREHPNAAEIYTITSKSIIIPQKSIKTYCLRRQDR